MKSLLLALLFFGLVVWGCYDVIPFKPIRRALRRTPRASAPPPPVEPDVPAPARPAARRRYR